MDCIDEATIVAFLGGALSATAVETVEAELDSCESCRQLMAEVVRSWHQQAPHQVHSVTVGTTIGRYQLERALGAGAMGVVYQAFDPVVDRRIAVKLLDLQTFADADAVMREAQAMGRVNHAAVVGIYDAGITEAYVYVAMELVQGQTLRQRLAQPPMPARNCYSMFASIAEGLAAAHDAGVVHRDFKPENVLLDGQGVAKVTDFGLARVPAAVIDGAKHSDNNITHAVGTPAYMAPEQLQGGSADARSDQYSFAVTLYEALKGQRPITATNMPALATAMQSPAIDWTDLSSGAKALLQRALALDPATRFFNMHDVARALRQLAAPRRWPWIIAAVTTSATIAAIVVTLARPRATTTDPCANADADVASAWTAGNAAALTKSYANISLPFAALASDTARHQLEAYAQTLSKGYTAACRATHVQHTQSNELLDRRRQCLDRGTATLQATGNLLANADANIVAHTTEALEQLADVRICDDVATLSDEVPMPNQPAKRSAVSAIRRQLAEAENTLVTTKFADGVALAEIAANNAGATGYRPIEAEALWVLGNLQYFVTETKTAQSTLERAALVAVAGRSRIVEAKIRARLADIFAAAEQAPQSQQQVDLGLALVESVTGSEAVKSRLISTQAAIMQKRGDTEGALKLLKQEVVSLPQTNLNERSRMLQEIGNLLIKSNRIAEALPMLQQSADQVRQLYGSDHPAFASCLQSLADAYQDSDPTKSISLMKQAHDVFAKLLPAQSAELAMVKSNLGGLMVEYDRVDEAMPYLQRANEIEKATLPDGDLSHAITLVSLGKAYFAKGKFSEALAVTETAERSLSQGLQPNDQRVATAQAQHGAILRALHRYAQAIAVLESALAAHVAIATFPDELAAVQFELAQALWALSPKLHRARIIKLLQDAEAALRASGDEAQATKVAAWKTSQRL
jgi:eukaryotic-like serine/threonine-protein kinase